jgi:hypothetical protein
LAVEIPGRVKKFRSRLACTKSSNDSRPQLRLAHFYPCYYNDAFLHPIAKEREL